MSSKGAAISSSANQCEICGKLIQRRRDLTRHKRTHSHGGRKFLCKVLHCKFRGAFRKDDLQKHTRRAHPMASIKGTAENKALKQAYEEQRNAAACLGLLEAADDGDLLSVQLMLDAGTDVDIRSDKGQSILHVAAAGGHEEMIKLVLNHYNIPFDHGDKSGRTPLWVAAQRGHEAVVRLLLEKGADIETRFEGTPLLIAAENGHQAVVQLLLDKGAQIEASWGGTPLFVAAKNGHEAVVQLLLQKGANIEQRGWHGQTALEIATKRGHEAVVRLLEDAVSR